jgi:hypothetical protein
MTLKDPFDILGYMSGPVKASSQQEREERQSRIVTLPEPASCTGIAS